MKTKPQLIGEVLDRLGDSEGIVWSTDEVGFHIEAGYQSLATDLPVFYDWIYLENMPRGFSYTHKWEKVEVDRNGLFDYGQANFTAEFERDLIDSSVTRTGPANHTSPFEATDGRLSDAAASTDISATADVPKSLTAIDRVTWDNRGLDGLRSRHLRSGDSRFEITKGEVYGFVWQHDGIRTLRKVRVPAQQCDAVTVNGSWGIVRNLDTISTTTTSGTWGCPRRVPSHHLMGSSDWGLPRRFYLDGNNVRVEHFRLGATMAEPTDICELPDRMAGYLRNYAQWKLLERPSAGQDLKLAMHYKQRWERDVARVEEERISVLGGDGATLTTRPPRPQLPWSYGQQVRY